MTREELDKLKLPDSPGVYMFLSGTKGDPIRTDGRKRPTSNGARILYIGKAASLRDRVRSYFSSDLAETRSSAIVAMVSEAKTLEYQTTDSVLEALIVEANLIKRHAPRYNIVSKDNKSFNYLAITKENFPQVLVIRGRDLFGTTLAARSYKLKAIYGPFPHGLQLRDAVKIVRRIFPFRDAKCTPCEDQLKTKAKTCRPCFNRQIGLCPGVCTGEVSKEEYLRVVRHICELFSGNFKGLKRQLTREMKEAAANEEFEKADSLRRQCEALEHIRDVSLIKADARIAPGGGTRIEAYDVAHTSGRETVAVMVVVNNGEEVKDAYRKFKIRTVANNDVAALAEAISRRLAHTEWPLPRVIVTDGGKGQVRAVEKILAQAGVSLPVIGVVKNEFHRPKRLMGDTQIIKAYENDILLANSEAHRFAINWHRKRRRRALV